MRFGRVMVGLVVVGTLLVGGVIGGLVVNLQVKTQVVRNQSHTDSIATTVDDLRRSMDCVTFYALGQRPPACTAVDARMDSIAAGGDPFLTTATTPTPRSPVTTTTASQP